MKIQKPPAFMLTVAFYLSVILFAAFIVHKMDGGRDCCNDLMGRWPTNITR